MKDKSYPILYRRGVSIVAKILVAGKIPAIGLELLKDHDVEMYDKEELNFFR